MIKKQSLSIWRITARQAVVLASPHSSSTPHRLFSSTISKKAKNQIFDPIRNESSLSTYLSLSTSTTTPLLTLWTASWCPSCRHISPLIHSLIRSGLGEPQGGVNLATVEFDAPDAVDLGRRYAVSAIPTLMAFDARMGEPVGRVVDGRKLADKEFLEGWIRNEASRYGGGGGGGSGGSAFGGLFGGWK